MIKKRGVKNCFKKFLPRVGKPKKGVESTQKSMASPKEHQRERMAEEEQRSHWFSAQRDVALPDWTNNVKKPTCFGLKYWSFLHSSCLSFANEPTQEDRQRKEALLTAFFRDVPCTKCRNHAAEYYRDSPPDFYNRRTLFTWSWIFHNFVNRRLGKEEISFDEALRLAASPLVHESGSYADNIPRDPAEEEASSSAQRLRSHTPHSDENCPFAKAGADRNKRKDDEHSDDEEQQQSPHHRNRFWNRHWTMWEWILIFMAAFGAICLVWAVFGVLFRTKPASKSFAGNNNNVRATSSLAYHHPSPQFAYG